MKHYYVPDLHEHSEASECDDGYFIVYTEDDVRRLVDRIRRWVTLVNTNELSAYEGIRQIKIDLDTDDASSNTAVIEEMRNAASAPETKPCPCQNLTINQPMGIPCPDCGRPL